VKLTGDDTAKTVTRGLDTAVALVRFGYNRDHADQIDLTEEDQGGVTVKVLSNPKGFPPGLRPSYAVKQGYLVLASTPEGVRRFTAPTAARAEAPLLRVSAKHLHGYLGEHRSAIAQAVAGWSGKPAEDVEKEFDELLAVLEAFDKVELRQSAGDGRVRLSLHIDFVKPLTK
jgi:hypothetical protein